ncbi:hypothetical protein STW0522KLE44_02960 [Klebsiella sp. STW0522-44]|nr:hypothetical protein STW0522KLE44_02960 [Klebsiella sp. STW0522-44]
MTVGLLEDEPVGPISVAPSGRHRLPDGGYALSGLQNKNPRIHIRGFIGYDAKNQASIAARSFFIAFFSS